MEEVDSGNNISLGGSPASEPPFLRNIHFFHGESPHCVCSWLELLFSVHWENRDQTTGFLYIRSWDFVVQSLSHV